MKSQSINFLQKIPPFFKGIKLQISVLLCSIGLFVVIYIFYKNSNEVKMQEISFDISSNNQLDSCAFNIGFNMASHISLEKKISTGISVELYPVISDSLQYSTVTFARSNNIQIDSVRDYANVRIAENSLSYNNIPKMRARGVQMKTTDIFIDNYSYSMERVEAYEAYRSYFEYNVAWTKKPTKRSRPATIHLPISTYSETGFLHSWNISSICLRIVLNPINRNKKLPINKYSFNFDFMCPMIYNQMFPEPDEITLSTLSFYTKEKIDYIDRNGLYLYAESVNKKNEVEMKGFILATILGFLFSVIIDTMYRIVSIKRKLQKEKDK